MSAYESQQGFFTQNGTYRPLNPVVTKVGDFTPFYFAIAICTVILGFLLILNVVCCCSRYSNYWLDRHTGNRWIVSIWSATPHKQPPLDLTELEAPPYAQAAPRAPSRSHAELRGSLSQQPLAHEFMELHKRESDL